MTYGNLGIYEMAKSLIVLAINIAEGRELKDLPIYYLYFGRICIDAREYDSALNHLRKAHVEFSASNRADWLKLTKLYLLDLRTRSSNNEIDGLIDLRQIEAEKLTPAGLEILRLHLVAALHLASGEYGTALKYSEEAVELLSGIQIFEYSAPAVYFKHYEILKALNYSVEKIQKFIEQAYQTYLTVEKGITKSQFKESYRAIRIHKLLTAEYNKLAQSTNSASIESFDAPVCNQP